MAAELEAELQAQLAEQQEALEGVQQLLAADPDSEETRELLADLQAGISETESALLGLKRQRLLAELDAMQPAGTAEQQADGVQQQGQEGAADKGQDGSDASLCVFRSTDGRHYYGWRRRRQQQAASQPAAGGKLEDGKQLEAEETVEVWFARPTRSFQLDPLLLPASACHPAPPDSLQPPAAEALHAGMRVIVQMPGRPLWQAAELAEVDVPGQQVLAVLLPSKQRHMVPLAAVALSAHAPDPFGSGSEDEGRAGRPGSSSWQGLAGGEEEEEEAEGSSMDESGSSETDEEEEEGEEDSDGEAAGGAGFGRVSLAMAEAASLMQQQTAAGPQSSTNLFFSSEAHSRGIGSKLMARMGFKGAGHGLGRNQQGMQAALCAAPMRRGAGLGVGGDGGTKEGAKKKKRRSGKQRRRAKAIQARADAREAASERQQALEQQTGSVGVFAFLNSIAGDASGAQAVKEANLGMGPATRQGHLFAGAGAGQKKQAPPKEEDRQALARRADDLAQQRQKVQRLSEMAARNAKDKVMLPQIKRALAEAQAKLAAAEKEHAASHRAIHDKEKQKRAMKF